MLTNLPRSTMSLGAEAAEQLHHVVIVFRRRIADAEYPIEQIGVSAIKQRLEPPDLVAVQGIEGALSERAENEVTFLSPAMPAPKQEALAANIRMFAICRLGKNISHLCSRFHQEPLLRRPVQNARLQSEQLGNACMQCAFALSAVIERGCSIGLNHAENCLAHEFSVMTRVAARFAIIRARFNKRSTQNSS
jgi:hypothetical protein